MMLSGENQSTQRKNCPSATLPMKSPTGNILRLNMGLHGDNLVSALANAWSSTFLRLCTVSCDWMPSATQFLCNDNEVSGDCLQVR